MLLKVIHCMTKKAMFSRYVFAEPSADGPLFDHVSQWPRRVSPGRACSRDPSGRTSEKKPAHVVRWPGGALLYSYDYRKKSFVTCMYMLHDIEDANRSKSGRPNFDYVVNGPDAPVITLELKT